MVQDFHVVRCFRCLTFQVQQVKKAKKWSCKLCGEKQSLLKEYGRGSGADCRRHVQKLNAARGAVLEAEEAAASAWSPREEEEEGAEPTAQQVRPAQGSRWSKYLDRPEEEEEEEEKPWVGRNRLPGNNTISSRKRRSPEEPDEDCTPGQNPKTHHVTLPKRPAVTSSAATSRPGSRWGHFLSAADRQGAEPPVGGWSPATKPRPTLPVSSMFESGEEFNVDDDFLTC